MTGAPALPAVFLDRPLAHRALHDASADRPENSRAAIRAAVEAGYGIEIDLQLAACGTAMVFHDYDLRRLTGVPGPIRQRSAAELADLRLGGTAEGIPTLAEVLDLVAGRVPLLVEIKDQDGQMGPRIGLLEQDAAHALGGYDGPVAVMSFNPNSVIALADLAPDIPRGLTTSAFAPEAWPALREEVRAALRPIPHIMAAGASFVSHEAADLEAPRIAELKAAGLPILCWTVRSPEDEAAARRVADNITFEGYAA
ncbi:cytoplasmic glycerophosphodiester phosphodiesterase [Roseivivax jejudonensis]|uniref:Cytoplasmic glycerophosphodiester phosphodiesterase n=1 Tax=Roseivivax jejudonensis TaxID=1529041 RepID=A0A1X6YF23_9RHOB|nr:glycerophosphodiester phosphodiesterase family protein [Roseivivax jejudonensis]SLN18780.1 cytoplasmic glycerophosphodiester phosphodiesterase [Roseivivax jejudonensis]